MSSEFTRCGSCGIIYHNPGRAETICARCRPDWNPMLSDKEKLRLLKGILRDAQAMGQLLTIPQLAERSRIEYAEIWQFIQSGDIDTTSFSDPEVRSFVQRQRMQLEREARMATVQSQQARPAETARKPLRSSGFHSRQRDD